MTVAKNADPEITVDSDMPTSIEPLAPYETTTNNNNNNNSVAVPFAEARPVPEEQQLYSKMCSVVAPSTLSAGYTFMAQVDGNEFVVTVPEGGVMQGQQFQVPYPTTNSRQPGRAVAAAVAYANANEPNHTVTVSQPHETHTVTALPELAPMGHWRDDLCDCFGVFCDTMFWNALCCTPLLYGQLMQRLHLNACGIPSATKSYERTFFIILGIWAVFWILMAAKVVEYVFYLFVLYFWIVFMNTRYQYRKRYQIPVSGYGCCDGRCNDFCCAALFCPCCVAIQMSRHTHDYHEVPYQCCSKTGLRADAPPIV
jgi:Cys-rich protein (TIGR01571 family)